MSSKWTDFDDAFKRLEERERQHRIHHPKSYIDKTVDELKNATARPDNNYNQGYSQDFLRRYGPNK